MTEKEIWKKVCTQASKSACLDFDEDTVILIRKLNREIYEKELKKEIEKNEQQSSL